MGREKALEKLHKQLQESQKVAISTLTGMGGIGKTELALRYALANRKKGLKDRSYKSAICWINVADQDNVGTQILNFAQNYLKITILEEGELEERVKHCWQFWGEEDTLIIFDDVREYKQIKDFLPPQQKEFKVIITTRKQRLAESIKVFTLEVLDEQSALDLIISFIGQERVNKELDEAKLLCKNLGYLPLGLELVSRFLKRRPNWSIKKYRDRLKDKGLQARGIQESTEEMTAQKGVKTAFEISWQELEKEAQEIACYLSLFEVAPIPYQLIKELCPIEDEDDLEDILEDSLINSSLIKDLGNQVYEIHTLINQYLREKLEESELVTVVKEAYCNLMVNIAKEIPNQPIKSDIEELTSIIPHLSVAAKELNQWIDNEELIWPYVGISRFYEGQGFYKEAEFWSNKSLNITKERLGADHPKVSFSLNNLAAIYHKQGRYKEAEPLYIQGLELNKKLVGEDYIYIATTLKNLALLYNDQGRYKEAEPLYIKTLELYIKILGEEHSFVAGTLNDLALLYKAQGTYSKAEHLYMQAFEMRKKLLGENHPYVASTLSNLAGLYGNQGKYSEAEPLYIQALEMCKRLLGDEHPTTKTVKENYELMKQQREES